MSNEGTQTPPVTTARTSAGSSKPDPRIARTQAHILTIARQMLNEQSGPLTFSTVAERAQVSRRTLYIHWGTIEALIADTVPWDTLVVVADDDLDFEAKLSRFLNTVATAMTGGVGGAIAYLMTAATYNEPARAALEKIEADIIGLLSTQVRPMSADEYAQLINPIVTAALMHGTVPESLIETLVKRGVEILA